MSNFHFSSMKIDDLILMIYVQESDVNETNKVFAMSFNEADIYLPRVNNENSKTMGEVFSKVILKAPKRHH